MKNIFSLLFAVIFALGAAAQLDRSIRPEAGPAPKLDFGKYKMYEMKNGLKVIVVENHKLPRVSMSLIIDRDPILEGDKAGYVSIAGEMLRQGTTNRTKDTLDEQVDFIGANLNTGSTSVSASGLSKYTDNLMEMLADVAMNPAFTEEEFEKLKKQTLSGIESNKDDADAIGANVFNAMVYGKDHPYGEIMTEATVNNITLEDCKAYYKKYWIPNNAIIAIVGDVKPGAIKKMVKNYFSAWEMGEVVHNEFSMPAPADGRQISFVPRESSVQSVLNIGNTIELQPGSPDEVKMRLTNQILGGGSMGRLFQNIREDKAYTYGAYSDYDSDKLVGEFSASASVRNEVTDSAVVEFFNEFEAIRNTPVSADELAGAKASIIGAFGRSLESPSTIARFALNIERYNLPEDYYKTYLTKLEALTAEDVMATAKKYINVENTHIVVVGSAAEVATPLKSLGTLKYYDNEANEIDEPTMPVPEGLTADSVINMYVTALGGAANLDKVKDINMKMDAEISGAPMTLSAVIVRKKPNKYKMEMTAAGMGVLMSQVYDGKKGFVDGMQGHQDLEGEELEEMERQSRFNPERNYKAQGYTLNLTSLVMLNGEKAYVMEVTDPKGAKHKEYYSAVSGLKLKSERTEDTPQGPMTSAQTFGDYREVNGVKYPYAMGIETGPQKVKMTVKELKVNTGVKDSDFK